MNPDFHQDAVEFVRAHNCACSTPVELVEEAMNHGAKAVAAHAIKLTKQAVINLKVQRARNLGEMKEIL